MRHRIAGGQLNRTSAHRVAMRRNLTASLFEHETISTTLPKAKHVRSFAEKLITLAKKGDLAARRRAISILGNRDIVTQDDGVSGSKGTVIGKLFSEIAPRYLDRPGGYTRIIHLSKPRLGDNGKLVLLQLVGTEAKVAKTDKKKSTTKSHDIEPEEEVVTAEEVEDVNEADKQDSAGKNKE